MPLPVVVPSASPPTALTQPGPTGLTTQPGSGSALNDGWTEGGTCIGIAYGASIRYSENRNRGWRLQCRSTIVHSGAVTKFPVIRFLSQADAYISAVLSEADATSPWVTPWTDVLPTLAATIQVRAQITRTAGGTSAGITIISSTIEYRWVQP